MFKVVFDTNIFISALHWAGTPRKIYERWLEGKFRLVVSKEILSELSSVLENEFADLTIPKQKLHVVIDDPDDDKILECALDAQTNYIISGDKHLLKFETYKGIHIITARQFLDLLASHNRQGKE